MIKAYYVKTKIVFTVKISNMKYNPVLLKIAGYAPKLVIIFVETIWEVGAKLNRISIQVMVVFPVYHRRITRVNFLMMHIIHKINIALIGLTSKCAKRCYNMTSAV
jgi:hypothetical protein